MLSCVLGRSFATLHPGGVRRWRGWLPRDLGQITPNDTRGVEDEDDVAVATPFSLHDAVDPAPDAARVEVSVVLGPLAEHAFLDEHREPGRTQGSLQALAVLEVSLLVPGHPECPVGVAVQGERGRADVNRAGCGAELRLGRCGRRVAEGRDNEREWCRPPRDRRPARPPGVADATTRPGCSAPYARSTRAVPDAG
jgi:hypothetical protein